MSGTVSIRPVRHPRYSFKVSFRETQPDGSRVRRFSYFTNKKAAKSFAQEKGVEIGNHGSRHSNVEDDERAALIRFREWAQGRDQPPTLSKLIERAIEAFEHERPPLTVAEAVTARLDAATMRGLSRRHIADLESRLNRFKAKFGPTQVADMKAEALEGWLHRLNVAPETWRNYAKAIGSVFALAVRRGFLSTSPLAGVDKPKMVRKAPGIIAPADLSKLLSAAAPELLPLLVLQAFCGLRRAEAERLTWGHIHFEAQPPYVELPAAVTKTSRRRICELPPCAVAWLQSLAGLSATTLGLSETIYRDRLRAAATTAKITWEANLLRHSFGTYKLATTRNAALVAEEMGNSAAVVRTHYNNVTSPEQAADYWRVLPSERPAAVVLPFVAETKAG